MLARHCLAVGRPVFVIRLIGFADPDLQAFDGIDLGVAQLGAALDALRRANCQSVCLAGLVSRPDLKGLKPDLRGLAALPGAIAAARKGDDGLLSFLVAQFEKEGFRAEGAHEVMSELALAEGALGRKRPGRGHRADIERAILAARAIGALDAGQGAVVCDGHILALEAQEGTDAMLGRVAGLPQELRGSIDRPRGVLAKVSKPGQEQRVDLPTIGPRTVRQAGLAGLAGIAGETGATLVLERDEVRRLADEMGLFVVGVAVQ
jgi:DUF1009 family protein